MFYGAGFTHSDVYRMPVYLRKFYMRKLVDVKKKEQQEIDKIRNKKPKKPIMRSIKPI